MKKALPFLTVEIIVSLVISVILNKGFGGEYLTLFGLINLLLGALGIGGAVIFSIMKADQLAKALVISSALLILMGTVTCSIFPFRMNG
jgi:hypothetical protein